MQSFTKIVGGQALLPSNTRQKPAKAGTCRVTRLSGISLFYQKLTNNSSLPHSCHHFIILMCGNQTIYTQVLRIWCILFCSI